MIMRALFSMMLASAALAAIAGEAGAQPNGAGGPGSCGQYMYWQKGTCADARNRPSSKTWVDEMLAKKWAG
jgi:hypothetical protein